MSSSFRSHTHASQVSLSIDLEGTDTVQPSRLCLPLSSETLGSSFYFHFIVPGLHGVTLVFAVNS